MKILTILSLVTSLLTPLSLHNIKNDKVLVGSGTNSMIDVSYYYGVEYIDMPQTSSSTPYLASANYYCDLQVNINGLYSGTVRINYTSPGSTAPSTYKINYVIYGCNATSTTVYNDYINVRIPDGAQNFTVRFYFNEAQIQYYGMSISLTDSHTETQWINQSTSDTVYFAPLSVSNSLTSINSADDYEIDYTSILNGSLYDNNGNGICYYLDDIAIKSENIYAELIAIHQDLIASINSLKTLSLADVPEYSWSIYYLFKRKWSLKYDSTFPRPYVTTTDDSSTTFSWDDAIQIQDRDLYIVLATFNDSSSTLPVKIIKSNNADVSSSFTWTYRYTGRYRFYYTRIPSDLFNNALNIKWTRAVNVMPVYLGRLNNMPLEVAEICNIDSNNQLIRELEKINNSINGLNNSNLNVEELDPTFIETINDGVTENLELIENPTIPEKLIGTLNYFTSPYVDFINNPKLSIYKYGILLSLIVSLFKVVTR